MTSKKVLVAGIAAGMMLSAQAPRRPPTPNDTLKSPEVLPDHRVVFRVYAPKATEVTISGDWISQGRGTGGPLEKDDKGIFSITVGPLVPDFYSYSFQVDGVKTLDPKNPMLKPGETSNDSLFEVQGEESAFEDNQPVPHGEIRIRWYRSSVLDKMRSMHVYTPPGYESSREKYPVFYLLHGGGDDDAGWSTIGRAGFILDNLLAAGKAKPMLVVMPNGSMPRPGVVPGAPQTPEMLQAQRAAQQKFVDELLQHVIPEVEKNYRVLTNRENRAIAGLSMGAGQTLAVAPSHLDLFAYLGVWSGGVNRAVEAAFLERNAAFLENSEKTNKMVKVLWIGAGSKDTLAGPGTKHLAEILDVHGIKHEYHETEGGHTWINWRHYLNDYAQLLFR